jgi:UDP-3-O-acyl N-acetylglucosamine deacetylase
MYTRRKQQTIARSAAVEGVGYWSGQRVRVEFRAAAADSGIVFVRGDLTGSPRIPADVAHRTDTPRRTNLHAGEATVEMVEHVMAALAGLQIDNCEVWTDAAEMPGCDGSSRAFVEALDAAGAVAQDSLREQRVIHDVIRVGGKDSWIEARPCCSGKTVLHYELDYGAHHVIGRQALELVLTPEVFRRELAPCRTFTLKAEAEALQRRGLGRHVAFRDLLVFDENGPIDNQLRFPDECVRHKMLDMAGDLALAGCELIGRFSAFRSGHHLNAELVRAVLAERATQSLKRCA